MRCKWSWSWSSGETTVGYRWSCRWSNRRWSSMEEAAAFEKEAAGSSSGSVASEGSELQVWQRWGNSELQVEL